jgi:hypothetical protein
LATAGGNNSTEDERDEDEGDESMMVIDGSRKLKFGARGLLRDSGEQLLSTPAAVTNWALSTFHKLLIWSI